MTDVGGLDKADAKHNISLTSALEIWIGNASRYAERQKRYTEKRPSVDRQHLHELLTYRMPENGTIQDAWTEIKRLTRHVEAVNPGIKGAFDQSQMFQQLLATLPPAYDTVRDAIDCHGEKDIDIPCNACWRWSPF
jgi:hypothetical protein